MTKARKYFLISNNVEELIRVRAINSTRFWYICVKCFAAYIVDHKSTIRSSGKLIFESYSTYNDRDIKEYHSQMRFLQFLNPKVF